MVRKGLFVLALVACGVGVYGLQELVDSRTDRSPSVRLRYLLATRNVRRASFGYPQVTADLIWIKAIQYYHQQFVNRLEGKTGDDSTRLTWLNQVAEMVTDLNPRFVRAYYFFSIYQGGEEETRRDYLLMDEEESSRLQLLRRGFQSNRHTYLLADHLAHTYYLFHKRVQEDLQHGSLDPARGERLLAHHRDRCLYYIQQAALAPDAPARVKLAASYGYPRALEGDICAGFHTLEQRYDTYTQDVERQDDLVSLTLSLDGCHVQQIRQQLEERQVSLEDLPFADAEQLASLLGEPVPMSPWSALENLDRSGDPPPETVAALLERYAGAPHRYEYFVAATGDIISWAEGDRRQETILGRAQDLLSEFHSAVGYCPQRLPREIEQSIPRLPHLRTILVDPFAQVAYVQRDLRDVQDELVRPYDTGDPEDRGRLLPELIRAVDGLNLLALQPLVDAQLLEGPPASGLSLGTLLGERAMPRSPWPLLDRFGDAPGEELPGTLTELLQALPAPDEVPDYQITPAGVVVAREVAVRLHEDLRQALQLQLDRFLETEGHPPADLAELRQRLPRPLPLSPLGLGFTLSMDGSTVMEER